MKVKGICNLQNGRAFKPDDWGTEGIPIIRIQNLNDMSAPFNYYAGEYSPVHEINDGELLFSWSGTPGTSFGAFRWNRGKGVLNQHIFKVLPKIDVDKDYLKYALNGNINTIIAKAHGGVGLQHITKKELDEIDVPIVSKKEQLEIVEQLMCIEKIILLRQTELKKLNEIIQARFVEMFGDPYFNTMGWKKLKIKDAVTVEPQNGMYKPQSDYVTNNCGVPILRIDGFYNGKVTDFSSLKRLNCAETERKKYLLFEDDIVINRVNSIEHLGKCAHIKGLLEDTVYESNMMRMHFDPKRFNPTYVCELLCSQFIYDQIINHAKKAVNQASINQKDVLDFDIYQPSIYLQNEFADFVTRTEKSKIVCLKILQKTAKFSCINPFL